MAPLPLGLLLSDSQLLPGSALESFLSAYGTLSLSSTSVVTSFTMAGQERQLSLPSASLDVVLSFAEKPGHHSAATLAELSRILKPGGKLVVQEPVARRAPAVEETMKLGSAAALLQTQAALEKALLFAGFTGATVTTPIVESGLAAQWTGVTPASIGSTQGPLVQPIAIAAKKPAWETGKSFALKKRANVAATDTATPGAPLAASVITAVGTRVKLSLDDVDDVTGTALPARPAAPTWVASAQDLDDDLVDEDSLLTAEDLAAPAAVPASDCGDGRVGKKACKNCTCGRAEMEEQAVTTKLTLDQIANPQSACGSCGLGDAFRCAGCPYRGLPAFKLGEKIALSSDLLRADV